MAAVKLTKNELKKQKDALKRFTRYLPTLILKKQQLQMEIRKVEEREEALMHQKDAVEEEFRRWIGVSAKMPDSMRVFWCSRNSKPPAAVSRGLPFLFFRARNSPL